MAKVLTEAEKMALRKARFSSGISMSTAGMLELSNAEKEKMLERKKRFNIVDNADEDQKRLERVKRFGLAQKDEEEQKLEERKKRFGTLQPLTQSEVVNQRRERFKDQYDAPVQKRRVLKRPLKKFGLRLKRNIKFTRDQKGFRKRNNFRARRPPNRRLRKFRRIN